MLNELFELFITILNIPEVRQWFSTSTIFTRFINELMKFLIDSEPNSIQLFVNNVYVKDYVTKVTRSTYSMPRFCFRIVIMQN
jgi:hypothetical protein